MTELCYPQNNSLLSVEQALRQILSKVSPIQQSEQLNIEQALGRILGETLYAPVAIPPHPNAAMDGYGLANQSIKAGAFSCRQVGVSWAGHPYIGVINADECIRIFTGAVVPDGVNCVVAQEQVTVTGDIVQFPAQTAQNQNIRVAGSDIRKGDTLLHQGTVLNPVTIGLLAAAGISEVKVTRRLRIGYFSSGDELSPLGTDLALGQIYDSNRHQLSALLENPLYELIDLGIVPDDPALLEHTFTTAAPQLDVLISTGGASVGDADFIQQILQKCGQVDLWKIAIKPGKPLAFGRIGECLFFGLPGNPIAVWVSVEKFVKPALLRLAGGPQQRTMRLQARCLSPLRKRPGREEYQRGILEQNPTGELIVTPVTGQDSHQLASSSQANCFIVLDDACKGVNAGDTVVVEPLQLGLGFND